MIHPQSQGIRISRQSRVTSIRNNERHPFLSASRAGKNSWSRPKITPITLPPSCAKLAPATAASRRASGRLAGKSRQRRRASGAPSHQSQFRTRISRDKPQLAAGPIRRLGNERRGASQRPRPVTADNGPGAVPGKRRSPRSSRADRRELPRPLSGPATHNAGGRLPLLG